MRRARPKGPTPSEAIRFDVTELLNIGQEICAYGTAVKGPPGLPARGPGLTRGGRDDSGGAWGPSIVGPGACQRSGVEDVSPGREAEHAGQVALHDRGQVGHGDRLPGLH